MAINQYIVSPSTGAFSLNVAAGAAAVVVAGEPGTGGPAGFGNFGAVAGTWGQPWATTFYKGQLIALDPAGQLFTAIGAGNLRLVTPAQETGGNIGVSN